MPLSPINLTTPVSGAPLDRLANKPHLRESEKIAEAARQFEAVLLRQILASARRTVIASDLNSPSTASDVYNDMVNDILATTISQTGAFGLANALQAQWLPDSLPTPPVAKHTP
jgi:flagellar protein FlgJ